jgi:hypothetical protein
MLVKVAAEAVSAEIDGQTVVLTPGMEYVQFDGTGGAIWRLVREGRRVDGIVDGLCELYEVDRVTADRDVRRFLAELADLGLVTLGD